MPKEKNWTGLKITAIFGIVLFAVVLAYIIGSRLSSEAIAVLAGSVCGVGAAIPTSLIIVFVVSRRNGLKKENNTVTIPQSQPTQPQIVVVPAMQYQQPQGLAPPQSTWRNSQPREFNVVGNEGWE